MNKQNGDRLIDGEQVTANKGGKLMGIGQKEGGLMDMDNSGVIVGGGV